MSRGEGKKMAETVKLDLKGLACPMPIIKISKAIKELGAGDRLEVRADDPAFETDVTAWCKKLGHTLVECRNEGTDLVAVIEKQ
jgi:tRNA 2-thiouridine synthesizing protein A